MKTNISNPGAFHDKTRYTENIKRQTNVNKLSEAGGRNYEIQFSSRYYVCSSGRTWPDLAG